MKSWTIICALFVVTFSISTSASLIKNRNASTGLLQVTDTDSGLDWLSLRYTRGYSYKDALTVSSGWRYAKNTEVESLFNTLFIGYYDTNPDGYSLSTEGAYSDQFYDTFTMWQNFGHTASFYSTTDQKFAGSFGLYEDENNVLRVMGAAYETSETSEREDAASYILGTSNIGSYETYRYSSDLSQTFGTYLVRESTAPFPLPLPPSLWLFGSGLFSLYILSKQKKA